MRILLSSLILLITMSYGGITDKHSNTETSPKDSRESIVVDDTKIFNQIRAEKNIQFREHQAAIALWNKKVEENRIAAQKAAARPRPETRATVTNPTTPTVVDKVDVRRIPDVFWDALCKWETAGNWSMNGSTFSGGVGFANSTWRDAMHGNWVWSGYPDLHFPDRAGDATREQQIIVAERVYWYNHGSGWGAWPRAEQETGMNF